MRDGDPKIPSELSSTEFFHVTESKPELKGPFQAELLNTPDGPTIFLNNGSDSSERSAKSRLQTQRGDVAIENISMIGYAAIQNIFDSESDSGMQAIKRALTEADFLTWQRPFMNHVY